MSKFFRRSPKPPSRDEQALNLEPGPAGQHQGRPRSASRLRLPWSSRSSTAASPARGNSPTPTTKLPTPTSPALDVTQPQPLAPPPVAPLPIAPPSPIAPSPTIAPPPCVTSSSLEPPAVLVHVPVPTVPSPASLPIERIWQRSIGIAQEKLRQKKLPLLDLSDPTLKSVGTTVEGLKSSIETGAGSGRFRRILKTIDSYGKIVDIAIQHHPEITSLVWAGVRAILQVALNHIEITESLEAAAETIVAKMAICEFYANVYMETMGAGIALSSDQMTHSLQQSLDSALPELYASVLVFSVKARQYFDPSNTVMTKVGNMLQSFVIEFKPFIDDMSEMEKRVQECADIATMDRIKRNCVELEQMHNLLKQIDSTVLKKIDNYATKAEEERIQKLLEILSPLDSPKRHQDKRAKRYAGSGGWLLQHPRFIQWAGNSNKDADRILCCYGMPGAGKTIISSVVIDDLITHHGEENVVYIYCDYGDQTNQTLVNILGSLLRQLLVTSTFVPEAITTLLESRKKHGQIVEVGDISEMLKALLLQRNNCNFLCLDALDELEPHTRFALLKALHTDFSTIRIFLTGRPHIQPEVDGALQTKLDAMHITADGGDIRGYLTHEIEKDMNINPGDMNDQLKEEILEAITRKAGGMFLLPALHISMVLEKPTKAARREALAMLPLELSDAYAGMLARIQSSNRSPHPTSNLGMRVLMWLHLATRPLLLVELQHALAVVLEEGKRGNIDLDEDEIPTQKRLLDCCLGLVIVDEETMTVRFVHYTLEEYFKHDGHSITYFPDHHGLAAQICLTYLNFHKLTADCTTETDLVERLEIFSFLDYAATHWGQYAAQAGCNEVFEVPAMKVLRADSRREHPHVALLALYFSLAYGLHTYYPSADTEFLGIHAAAYFGLGSYMTELGKDYGWDPKDVDDRTPLSWAAASGHEPIVRLLVEREDVDVDSKDNVHGRTPLSWAAISGHEPVVQLLVGRENVDSDSKDSLYGRTPLSWAAASGHEAVVRLLVGRADVEADSKSKSGRTPLSWAAKNSHQGVVRLLVGRADVEADSKDKMGRTPLSWAARYGNESVVGLLVCREDVEVDSKDSSGRTPLSLAAENGHEAVVRLLVGREDVDPNSEDTDGRTPLWWATAKGHEKVVQLLSDYLHSDT